jgi:hypothetical protein
LVLEWIGLAAQAWARRLAFVRMAERMEDAERAALDGDVGARRSVAGRSRFAWLRDTPDAPMRPLWQLARAYCAADPARPIVVAGDEAESDSRFRCYRRPATGLPPHRFVRYMF